MKENTMFINEHTMLNNKMSQENHIIEMREVTKVFRGPAGEFVALWNINVQLPRGAFIAVAGKSGSGKSTLLHMIAGIDCPSSGEVHVAGKTVHLLDTEEAALWRGKNVGVVFQFFQLLPTLTVLENVLLPMDLCGIGSAGERRSRAKGLLEQFGLSEHGAKFPAQLSGGQQQRAAIARALANDPQILIADEPTGNLDSETALSILNIFQDLSSRGKTVVIATHERDITRWADRVVTLSDGKIAAEAGKEKVNASNLG